MKRGNPSKPTVSESCKVENGLSIPDYLRKFPNILELWLKRPDRPPHYISPTFAVYFEPDGLVGRVYDRGRGRGVWKHGQSPDEILEAIDAELGRDWPDYRFTDKLEAAKYSERKDRLA